MNTVLMESVSAPSLAISEEADLVRSVLLAQGLETPLIYNGLSRDQKYERIKESFADIAHTLGLDLTDDSLAETPQPDGMPSRLELELVT